MEKRQALRLSRFFRFHPRVKNGLFQGQVVKRIKVIKGGNVSKMTEILLTGRKTSI